MRRKDTAVMDAIASIKDNNEVVEEKAPALSDKEIFLKQEKEKIDKMSLGELQKFALKARENQLSSHDKRDELEGIVREKEEQISEANETIAEKDQKISDLEKQQADKDNAALNEWTKLKNDHRAEVNELNGQISQLSSLKTKNEELKKSNEEKDEEIKKLEETVADLANQIKDKENAAKNTQLNLERANKAEIDKLNEGHEAKLEKCKERIKKLESDLKEVKADNKKLKADLEKAQDSADYFKKSFGVARDANFAGMIVRDIPKEIGLGFETVDEKVKDMFETLMTDVRGLYLSTASGVIKAADDKISNQETAAAQLKKAEKDLQDSEDLSKLADQRREEARKRVEEAERNFIEAKGEEA